MSRAVRLSLPLAAFVALASAPAHAEPPAAPHGPLHGPPRGLAVLALEGAKDAAWPLARAIYARPDLRPPLDDAHARVLAGEAPAAGAPAELGELAELRGAVKGDDAPSRQLLSGIADRLAVRGVVVVWSGPPVQARVFVRDAGGAGTFDAARYAPDEGTDAWGAAVTSLGRAFGAPPPAPRRTPAPAAASVAMKPAVTPEPPKKFYESAWFWGAIGAALFAGGAVWFATRDNDPNAIHLQMQVPR